MNKLTIIHNAGFFSCCSVRLYNIINYFNKNKKLPEIVDSSQQFKWYKANLNNNDITFIYFDNYNIYNTIIYKYKIDYHNSYQYLDYHNIKYDDIHPFIIKYFSPSQEIKKNIKELEEKYKIDYNNTCVLFYRGNDKNTETLICDYDQYIIYAQKILNSNPNIIFLIQSDETEFIEKMIDTFPQNSFYMKDEIRHIKKCNNTVDKLMKDEIDKFSKNYLGITIIMSKCKYIICGTGNCSIWIMLYRRNNKNVYQNRNGEWILPKL